MNEVYKIENKVNGKVYIGITNQGKDVRFGHHLYETRSGSSFPIHNAIRKHGFENFTVETVAECETYQELKDLEKKFIKEYKSKLREFGYNLTDGGDGTFGRFHSDATKDKIRQKRIGSKVTEGKHIVKINHFNENGIKIAEYSNMTEAVKSTGRSLRMFYFANINSWTVKRGNLKGHTFKRNK